MEHEEPSTETFNDIWIKCRKQSITQYLIDFLSFGSIFSSDFKLEIRFNCNKPVLEVWVAVFKPLFLLVNYSKPYTPIGRDGCFNISARTSTPLRTLMRYTCKMKISLRFEPHFDGHFLFYVYFETNNLSKKLEN